MKQKIVLTVLLCALMLPALAQQRATTQLPSGPLSLQDLNLLLRRQVGRDLTEANLAVLIDRVGIAFDPTPEAVSRLRANGAHQHLINIIKRAAERLSATANDKVVVLRENPDPFLEETRRNVRDYLEELPDFICQQDIERFYDFEARGAWDRGDKLSYELTYSRKNGESYKPVNSIGRPATRSLGEAGGATSTGEFASRLTQLFDPKTQTVFRAAGRERLGNHQAAIYDFSVAKANSHLTVKWGDAPSIIVGYTGSIWIDVESKLVLRVDLAVDDLPPSYPMTNAENSIDYDLVKLRGLDVSFLLPIRAEMQLADRRQKQYFRNLIYFKFYRKFETDIKITDEPAPTAPIKP